MTNFDFLLSEPDFASFASVAVAAENLLHIDRDFQCALLPAGHGVCGQVDVLRGQGADASLG